MSKIERSVPRQWKIAKANWNQFQCKHKLPNIFITLTDTCIEIENKIIEAAQLSVPKTSGTFSNIYSNCWWNSDCSAAQRCKIKTFNWYKKNLGNIILLCEFKKRKAFFRVQYYLQSETAGHSLFQVLIQKHTPAKFGRE